jgi:hypothetical protein
MKTPLVLLGFLLIPCFALSADPNFTIGANRNGPGPVLHYHPVNLSPRPTGVFADAPHAGFQLISPFAPARYGNGEKYAAWPTGSVVSFHLPDGPSGTRQVDHVPGPGANRDAGGIKLFGFEF